MQVLQYDLGAGTPAAVAQSGIEVYNVSNRNNAKNLPYHSQRGADGLIYFAVPDAPALDAILAPNARGRACRYTPAYLSLRGRLSAEALPGQLNDANLGPLLAPEAVAGCVGQPLLLRAGVVAGSGAANDSLRWWPGDGRAAIDTRASEDSLKVSYPAAGTYTLRVARRRQGVEIATATAMVRISPGPRVRLALAPDTAACAPLSLQLRVGTQPAGSTYRWQDGSTAATLVATAPGMYWVDVRAAAGCVARASVQVRELPCTVSATSLPTIITPNGDQLNQAFVLRGLDAPDWTLRVYNRWGREVFQQVSYDNRWEAQGQSDGGYFYQLRHRTTGQVLKGWVEVRR